MASISFGGLGNGLDFGQVVDQLVRVQRLPIDQLEPEESDGAVKIDRLRIAWGQTSGLAIGWRCSAIADRLRSIGHDRIRPDRLDRLGIIGCDARVLSRPGDAIGAVASDYQQRSHSRFERDHRYRQWRVGHVYLPRRNGNRPDCDVERCRHARRLADRHQRLGRRRDRVDCECRQRDHAGLSLDSHGHCVRGEQWGDDRGRRNHIGFCQWRRHRRRRYLAGCAGCHRHRRRPDAKPRDPAAQQQCPHRRDSRRHALAPQDNRIQAPSPLMSRVTTAR